MIHSLTSTLTSFKQLEFRPGLNLLVARRTKKSTDKQTRNGLGKSSFVDLVHFMLGANVPEFLKQTPQLATQRFALDFDLGGQSLEVERAAVGRRSETAVRLVRGDPSGWPTQPKRTRRDPDLLFKSNDWKALLGIRMFGLSAATDEGDDEQEGTGEPTFRMMFPYFARRDRSGGFLLPEQHDSKQQLGDQQIALTYLLGLDVSIPSDLQALRKRESALNAFKSLSKSGALGGRLQSASEVFTELSIAEQRAKIVELQLAGFRVVERYSDLEEESNALTRENNRLSEENEADLSLISSLEESLRTEKPPRYADVEQAFKEVSVVLPGLVKRRFEEVDRFHASIIRNRSSHLEGEIQAARDQVARRRLRMTEADRRRSEILVTLQAGGALEQYTRFQSELTRLQADVARLRQLHSQMQRLEGDGLDLGIERMRIFKRLKDDHAEQSDTRKLAIQTFEKLSEALYENEQAGSLEIDATENGPVFKVKIPAGRSTGKNHMQAFCFDMMLMELVKRRGIGPGFLIHDSALFDGVDGRQVGRALELGRKQAEEQGFQYIVTINEDALEQAQKEAKVSLRDAIIPVRLTDEVETGGLFGFRFD